MWRLKVLPIKRKPISPSCIGTGWLGDRFWWSEWGRSSGAMSEPWWWGLTCCHLSGSPSHSEDKARSTCRRTATRPGHSAMPSYSYLTAQEDHRGVAFKASSFPDFSLKVLWGPSNDHCSPLHSAPATPATLCFSPVPTLFSPARGWIMSSPIPPCKRYVDILGTCGCDLICKWGLYRCH